RIGPEKHRRVEHLDVDFQLVHVLDARGDVRHLARLARRVAADISCLAVKPAVDQPRLASAVGVVGCSDYFWAELALGVEHIVPGVFALQNMSIRVDDSHGQPRPPERITVSTGARSVFDPTDPPQPWQVYS